jgi:hypothetical protein
LTSRMPIEGTSMTILTSRMPVEGTSMTILTSRMPVEGTSMPVLNFRRIYRICFQGNRINFFVHGLTASLLSGVRSMRSGGISKCTGYGVRVRAWRHLQAFIL